VGKTTLKTESLTILLYSTYCLKWGAPHFRHSLASNLLSSNTPMPVITGILGHKNSNSTNLYLRIDIDSLRSIALEVPNER